MSINDAFKQAHEAEYRRKLKPFIKFPEPEHDLYPFYRTPPTDYLMPTTPPSHLNPTQDTSVGPSSATTPAMVLMPQPKLGLHSSGSHSCTSMTGLAMPTPSNANARPSSLPPQFPPATGLIHVEEHLTRSPSKPLPEQKPSPGLGPGSTDKGEARRSDKDLATTCRRPHKIARAETESDSDSEPEFKGSPRARRLAGRHADGSSRRTVRKNRAPYAMHSDADCDCREPNFSGMRIEGAFNDYSTKEITIFR